MSNMNLEPRIIKCESEEALKRQTAELEKQGRRIIDCNVFEEGLVGKLGFRIPPEGKSLEKKWTAQDADAIWLTWEKFGQVLQPERIMIKDGNSLFRTFAEHKDHPMMAYTNSVDKTAGFVCFCKASEGKSFVAAVKITDLKQVPPELLRALEPLAEVIPGPKTRG
jgi:hypothetical protein